MLDWIRDVCGINKYALVWDFEHNGIPLKGRHDGLRLGGMTKHFAQRLANQMNRSYDTDGHWVERA